VREARLLDKGVGVYEASLWVVEALILSLLFVAGLDTLCCSCSLQILTEVKRDNDAVFIVS